MLTYRSKQKLKKILRTSLVLSTLSAIILLPVALFRSLIGFFWRFFGTEILVIPKAGEGCGESLLRISHYFSKTNVIIRYKGEAVSLCESINRPSWMDKGVTIPLTLSKITSNFQIALHFVLLRPVFLYDSKSLLKYLPNCFNVDPVVNANEGWEYFNVWSRMYPLPVKKIRLKDYPSKKTYIFGTGPSLDTVENLNFKDSYRIVCNTIVKNKTLVEKLDPDFLVFGDAIYHFGPSVYAAAFRRSLDEFLSFNKRCKVLVPHLFYGWLLKEFPAHTERIFSIGKDSGFSINLNFSKKYLHSRLDNVLTILQIPLAAGISRDLNFLGFDGRKESDKGFWKHSEKNNFVDLLHFQEVAHPGFFRGKSLSTYSSDLSEVTEIMFSRLEKQGFVIKSLNDSNNPAFSKRYLPLGE